jgi:uncharacterized protein YuzE
VDVLRIVFTDTPIKESDELAPGINVDYDDRGRLVGLEIHDASTSIAHYEDLTQDSKQHPTKRGRRIPAVNLRKDTAAIV